MSTNAVDTDLLAIARSVLRDELLKALPDHKRYEALMVANAMAIAAREATLGPITAPPPSFSKSLSGLLDQNAEPEELVSGLIERLRKDEFNPENPKTQNLQQILMLEADRKVQVSNPRYLKSEKT